MPTPLRSDLNTRGFVMVSHVLSPAECNAITQLQKSASVSNLSGSTRNLLDAPWCQSLAKKLRKHPMLLELLDQTLIAVQCNYFEKSTSQNWMVPYHQDLTIPVVEKIIHNELKGWTAKEGTYYVQAPPVVLEQIIIVRLHLDECSLEDGPLSVIPKSHLQGILTPETIEPFRKTSNTVTCTASLGDCLVMKPLLLHASSKTSGKSSRRICHFIFGPPQLPYGLRWKIYF